MKSLPGKDNVSYSGFIRPDTGELFVCKPSCFNYETTITCFREYISANPIAEGKKYVFIVDNAPWHIKRRFIDCQGYDPDSTQMVVLLNRLYHNDHKHKVGEDGWTVEDNLKWRQKYAPDILADIREHLDKMLARTDILPKSDLAEAVGYLDMEWDAVVDIFKRGDTNLDNNLVERMNRYFSMSRRSSLFFGSHSGAERAAVLYTIALSAKMNGINLFEYIVDILDNWNLTAKRTAGQIQRSAA